MTPANVQDRNGGRLLFAALGERLPLLAKVFADRAYRGPQFQHALAKLRPLLQIEIITCSEQSKGFVVLPKRWRGERTLAWLNRCRRLAEDFENRLR